ncbi:DUF6204 family protein [Krasilnikovia sp. MM14-A1259]|uniref:DUF6204 family protein n=1 Tax=Krasilnikovia sp. MM14-A1259 TaxID=3373539 RepID=UPI00399CC2A1
MSSRPLRITVRGAFADLTDAQRAGLLADAAAHDVLRAEHTREGHLTYDVAARPFFTFRFADEVDAEQDIPAATERAVAAAQSWLTGHGYGFRDLTAQTVDLSQIPMGSRGRKEEARRARQP